MKYVLVIIIVGFVARSWYKKWQETTSSEGNSSVAQRSPSTDSEPPAFDEDEMRVLLQTDEPSALELLAALAVHPQCPAPAIEFIKTYYANSRQPVLNNALVDAAFMPRSESWPSILELLFAIGLSLESYERLVESVTNDRYGIGEPWFFWQVDELTLDGALRDCRLAGLLPKISDDQLRMIYEDYGFDDNTQPHKVLHALIRESECAIAVEAYKPGKLYTYEEFLIAVFDRVPEPLSMEDFELDWNREADVASEISFTVNGYPHLFEYAGNQLMDFLWVADCANQVLAHHGETVRCIEGLLDDDLHVLFVGNPADIMPVFEKYHLSYADQLLPDFEQRRRDKAREHSLRTLARYAENTGLI